MQIVKSLHAGVLHKTFEYQGKYQFALSALWGFRLSDASPVLEQDLWTAIGESLGTGQIFDAAMPKHQGEFLVHGCFIPPGGQAVAAGSVEVEIGPLKKRLSVFGDRYWIKAVGAAVGITDPVSFSEMPLDFSRAFGGEGFKQNTVGKGLVEVDVAGEPRLPLPNVEYAEQLIGSPGDRPRPAGFGALDPLWSPRIELAGTYDQKYIDEQMPGLPNDIDWRYFNVAAQDQWIEGFWNGKERYRLLHMNADHEELSGELPGIDGRGFVTLKRENGQEFLPLDTRLDTIWFFPGQDLGVLVHRGALEVADRDGRDVIELVVAHENMGDTPRSPEFYQAEMNRRTDPEEGYKFSMDSTPFIPLGCVCGFKQLQESNEFPLEMLNKQNMESFAENQEKDAREKIQKELDELEKKLGESAPNDELVKEQLALLKQLESLEVKPSPEVERIHAAVEKILPGAIKDPKNIDITRLNFKAFEELEVLLKQIADEKRDESNAAIQSELDKLKDNENLPEVAEQIERLEEMLQPAEEIPQALPRMKAEEYLQVMEKEYRDNIARQVQELNAAGMAPDALPMESELDLAAMREQVKEGEIKFKDGYRMGAHYMPRSTSPHPGEETDIRDGLLAAFKGTQSAAEGDYAFVDLSHEDLTGINLSNSFLEYANLRGAILKGANLSGAILAHADLSEADLTNAVLTGANLGAATLEGTLFIDADLAGVMFARARLQRTVFRRCQLTERMEMFLEASLQHVDFTGSNLSKAVFLDHDLRSCCFAQAILDEACFLNVSLGEAVFDHARIAGVNFVNVNAEYASFKEAEMTNARFVGGCNLTGSTFERAEAGMASFREANVEKCRFPGALLDQADFGGAVLRQADFSGSSAIRAQFAEADMRNSNLSGANFMEASLYKARLGGVAFTNGNFYATNFIGSAMGDNEFSGAYLEQTVIRDWRHS